MLRRARIPDTLGCFWSYRLAGIGHGTTNSLTAPEPHVITFQQQMYRAILHTTHNPFQIPLSEVPGQLTAGINWPVLAATSCILIGKRLHPPCSVEMSSAPHCVVVKRRSWVGEHLYVYTAQELAARAFGATERAVCDRARRLRFRSHPIGGW